MNRAIKVLSLIIMVAALIFGGYKLFFQKEKKEQTEIIKAKEDNSAGQEKIKEALIPVKVITSERGDLPLRKSITAIADVWEKAVIKAEVSSKVDELHGKIGQLIQKNQLVVKLDDFEQKLNVENHKANKLKTLSNYLVKESTEAYTNPGLTEEQKKELKEKKDKYEKAVWDFEKGKISKEEFERINSEYDRVLVLSGETREEVLKATENLTQEIIALKQAERDLERTSIKSPFPGIVTNIMVSKGEKVNVGQDVVKIINLNSLYLKGFALESEIPLLKKGIRVRIKFDAFPETYYYGEIQMISPEVDPQNKTIPIYVKVDNKDNLFYPGMNAELDIEYEVRENVIKVPIDAIIPRQGRYLVFVVEDIKGTSGTAMWHYVELGDKNDEEQEIKSGIEAGDLVVVEGQMTLAHQSKVKIIE